MKMIRRFHIVSWTAVISGLLALLRGNEALAQFNATKINHELVQPVPTINEWGMIIMFVILAALALYVICRRIRTSQHHTNRKHQY